MGYSYILSGPVGKLLNAWLISSYILQGKEQGKTNQFNKAPRDCATHIYIWIMTFDMIKTELFKFNQLKQDQATRMKNGLFMFSE